MKQSDNVRNVMPVPNLRSGAVEHQIDLTGRESSADIPKQLLAQSFAIDREESSDGHRLTVPRMIRPPEFLNHSLMVTIR
ncbi:MAG: hypothetical protein BGO93_31365 [Mesorhizobium sp. 65-26]|nr:MAG: hypothetical protein BGO93_31365 [Mesorhizobium sp. 65-26]